MVHVPDPLKPGPITGRMLLEFLNGLRALLISAQIKTDPASGLESRVMEDYTALWIRRRSTTVIKLTISNGDGSYDWIEQDPLPAAPWWQDAVGPGASGSMYPTSGAANPAITLNPTDPVYPINHVVPARRDPRTNRMVIMAGG